MAAIVRHPSPRDFHNPLADDPSAVAYQPADGGVAYDVAAPASSVQQVDISSLEMAAFEKGRMQGELEAVRRLEAEAPMKTFQQDTTVVAPQPDVVEINQMTGHQWAAAILGEVLAAGYIVLMAIWIAEYRTGGVAWENSDRNGSRGMFNTHVLVSFIGLWFASQAYITYRLMPINLSPTLNKAYYIFCHAAALTCFGLAVAAAVLSTPFSRTWSMHAWTSYLAVAVYAAHAIYSSIKVLFHRHGIRTTNWNESRHGELPRATPEQRRDVELPPTMYMAGPSAGIWRRFDRERNLDVDAANANRALASPRWSERLTFPAHRFFLVPRKKWAVTSLFGLMAAVIGGISEWQMLHWMGRSTWPYEQQQTESPVSNDSNESIIAGVIGLAVLAGTMLIGYAAMPPRTTLTRTGVDVVNKRTSVSMGSTAQNSRVVNEYDAAVVV